MLSKLKLLLKKLPVPLSKNHRYDLLTRKIIRQYCKANSNCIDVGAHRGNVLDWLLHYAPDGRHYAFEPIPVLYDALKKKYATSNCSIYNMALSDHESVASFNYVLTNPAYSGLKKRKYDRRKESDTVIQVKTNTLNNVIPSTVPIRFIKIDVEGGEMDVLKGATRILSDDRPIIVFEFGIGGSDIYGTTPDEMYSFLSSFNYRIFLLDDFVNHRPPLTTDRFRTQFNNKLNYYFVAA